MQSPASGATVADAIAQALRVAGVLAENERRLDSKVSEDCRLWLELLRQSQRLLLGDKAPAIARGELGSLTGLVLTQRRWIRFQRWFTRHMAPQLHQACVHSGVPALYGGRISNRRGGRAEYNEAHYFVSFDAPKELAFRTTASGHQPFYGRPGEGLDCPLPDTPDAAHTCGTSPPLNLEVNLRAENRRLSDLTSQLKRMLIERDLEIDNLKTKLPTK